MEKTKDKDGIQLARLMSSFLNEYAPLQLSSSQHTLNGYRTALSIYIDWLETVKKISPSNFSCSCFEVKMIEEWMRWLKQRGNSNDTCNIRLGAIRSFIKYIGKQEVKYRYLSAEAAQVKRFKKDKKHIDGLSRNAVKAILEAPDTSTVAGKRYLLMMILMYSLGARLDELLSLRIKDIHLNVAKPCITLTGKGRKVRTIGLSPKVVLHVKSYLAEFHPNEKDDSSLVFYTNYMGKNEKISQAAVRKALRKYASIAHEHCDEVPLTLHPHQFRHAKAQHMLDDGVNIVQISEFLGHESLDTTKVYLEITDRMKVDAYATMDDEKKSDISKKWKTNTDSLRSFLGFKSH